MGKSVDYLVNGSIQFDGENYHFSGKFQICRDSIIVGSINDEFATYLVEGKIGLAEKPVMEFVKKPLGDFGVYAFYMLYLTKPFKRYQRKKERIAGVYEGVWSIESIIYDLPEESRDLSEESRKRMFNAVMAAFKGGNNVVLTLTRA